MSIDALVETLTSGRRVFVYVGTSLSSFQIPELWRREAVSRVFSDATNETDPSLVWELAVWLRSMFESSAVSDRMEAFVAFVNALKLRNDAVTVVTNSVDGGFVKAGLPDVAFLSGRIDEVRCESCATKVSLQDVSLPSQIAKAAQESSVGSPRTVAEGRTPLPTSDLPKCPRHAACGHHMRPNVSLVGENFNPAAVEAAEGAVADADVGVFVGVSITTEPASRFAQLLQARGKKVAVVCGGLPSAPSVVTVTGTCTEILENVAERIRDGQM